MIRHVEGHPTNGEFTARDIRLMEAGLLLFERETRLGLTAELADWAATGMAPCLAPSEHIRPLIRQQARQGDADLGHG